MYGGGSLGNQWHGTALETVRPRSAMQSAVDVRGATTVFRPLFVARGA